MFTVFPTPAPPNSPTFPPFANGQTKSITLIPVSKISFESDNEVWVQYDDPLLGEIGAGFLQFGAGLCTVFCSLVVLVVGVIVLVSGTDSVEDMPVMILLLIIFFLLVIMVPDLLINEDLTYISTLFSLAS